MKMKELLKEWKEFLNETRAIESLPVAMSTEKERNIGLSMYSGNSTYKIVEGPFHISKDYVVLIVEYKEFYFGIYSTSGFSSAGHSSMTDIKWILTGGVSPNRIQKLPDFQMKDIESGNIEKVHGKYPVNLKGIYSVLVDLSNNLDPKIFKQKVYNFNNVDNFYRYVKILYPSNSLSESKYMFDEERHSYFNKLLERYGALRDETKGLDDWKEVLPAMKNL